MNEKAKSNDITCAHIILYANGNFWFSLSLAPERKRTNRKRTRNRIVPPRRGLRVLRRIIPLTRITENHPHYQHRCVCVCVRPLIESVFVRMPHHKRFNTKTERKKLTHKNRFACFCAHEPMEQQSTKAKWSSEKTFSFASLNLVPNRNWVDPVLYLCQIPHTRHIRNVGFVPSWFLHRISESKDSNREEKIRWPQWALV